MKKRQNFFAFGEIRGAVRYGAVDSNYTDFRFFSSYYISPLYYGVLFPNDLLAFLKNVFQILAQTKTFFKTFFKLANSFRDKKTVIGIPSNNYFKVQTTQSTKCEKY